MPKMSIPRRLSVVLIVLIAITLASCSLLTVDGTSAFDDDGKPLSTWISVSPSSAIGTEHEIHIDGDTAGVRAQLERRFDGEVLEILKVIAHGAHELEIERERVSVCLPALLGVDPGEPASKKARALTTIAIGAEQKRTLLTGAIVEQKLSRLCRLITLLRGQAGPYR